MRILPVIYLLITLGSEIHAGNPVLIDDDFSTNTGWYKESSKTGDKKKDLFQSVMDSMYRIEDHRFKIRLDKGKTLNKTRPFTLNVDHDWKIEAVFQQTGADLKAVSGIIFGSDSGKNMEFFINGAGGAAWTKNGETMNAKEDLKAFLATGKGAVNKLTISHVTQRQYWSFRVNDNEVFVHKSYPFAGNLFGFTGTDVDVMHYLIYDWSLSKTTPDSLRERDNYSRFFEAFHSNNREWDILENEDFDFSLGKNPDKLRCQVKTDSWYVQTKEVDYASEDFRMDLAFDYLKIDDPNATMGLVFSSLDSKNTFAFAVAPCQQFRVFETKKGDFHGISEWLPSEVIRKTGTNNLTVENRNMRWIFTINGTKVYSCAARPSKGRQFGFRMEGVQIVALKTLNVVQEVKPEIVFAEGR